MRLPHPIRWLRERWARPDHRGQSLVEFALTLPVLLVIVLGTVDLGRAYFRTENITNAVKEGAFFGARSPTCDTNAVAGCNDPKNVHWRVEQELNGITLNDFEAKCFAPGTTDFSGTGKALADCEDGDLYFVAATTPFDLITPIIAGLVGNSLTLSANSVSVVLTDFDTTGTTGFPSSPATPTPAPGICTVPDFTNGTKINQAQDVWTNVAGFNTTVTTSGAGGQQITWQSLPLGFQGPCTTTTIVVATSPQATATPTPLATPSPTPSGATPTPTPTGATPSPTPTGAAQCTVPQLVRNPKITITQAQAAWTAAGFSAGNFSAVRPPNNDYSVGVQNVTAGLLKPCLTQAIQVDK